MSNFNVPLLFMDTETTSLNRHTRVPWEVALIRREPTGEERRRVFQIELNSYELAKADPESLRINGFHDRYDPIEAFSKRTAAAFISEFTEDANIVGMVPSFDIYGFENTLDYADLKEKWHYQYLDVDNIAYGFYLAKGKQLSLPIDTDWVLDDLAVEYIEEDRHTAMGDAELTRRYFDALHTNPDVGDDIEVY